LIVRFGDHQPAISPRLINPSLDDIAVARHIQAYDPKYFTTYYAIDAVNYRPVNLSSALDRLDAPYLPIVVLEAAGLPLDPSFVEQRGFCSAARVCSMPAGTARSAQFQPDAHRRRAHQGL